MKLATPNRNTKDGRGNVRVIIQLTDGRLPVRGNISRALSVNDAKVSEVLEIVRAALVAASD